jgi:O-acetyl-ADP-ribose deacetylase (regulator of RNase III)
MSDALIGASSDGNTAERFERKFGTRTVSVVLGNIVEQADCDAIVNSANERLRAGSGVCGAIYRAAGKELEPCSVQLAPLALGAAVATPGFNLPNRHIIHVRGPKYLFDPDPAENLAKAMRSVLVLAEQIGVSRVAVPAISMGVYAYPPEQAVPILVQVAADALSSVRHLVEVRFVVVSASMFLCFADNLRQCCVVDCE